MFEFIVKAEKFPDRRWFGENVKAFEKMLEWFVKAIDSSIAVTSFEEITSLPDGAEDRSNGNFILDPVAEKSGFDMFLEDTDRVWSVIGKLQNFAIKIENSIPMVESVGFILGTVLVPDKNNISEKELELKKALIRKFREKADFLAECVCGE